MSFALSRSGRRAGNLVRGRGRVRRRLQVGARVLRDVGEIGRQSCWPNGRRFGPGSIVVWFGHGVSPRDTRPTGSSLVCSDKLLGVDRPALAATHRPSGRLGFASHPSVARYYCFQELCNRIFNVFFFDILSVHPNMPFRRVIEPDRKSGVRANYSQLQPR